jgi:hypothetical protein
MSKMASHVVTGLFGYAWAALATYSILTPWPHWWSALFVANAALCLVYPTKPPA